MLQTLTARAHCRRCCCCACPPLPPTHHVLCFCGPLARGARLAAAQSAAQAARKPRLCVARQEPVAPYRALQLQALHRSLQRQQLATQLLAVCGGTKERPAVHVRRPNAAQRESMAVCAAHKEAARSTSPWCCR